MAAVEQEREDILAAIAGRTLCDLFMDTCRDHPADVALSERSEGTLRRKTFSDYKRLASQVAMGLRSLGVAHNDTVGIMASNRPEHVIADVGAMLAAATPVSVYNTLAPEQVSYIAGDAAMKVAIVEQQFVDKWRSVRDELPGLEILVLLDAEPAGDGEVSWTDLLARGAEALTTGEGEFENTWRSANADDVATIIYTSGTTGPPKGVQLTHANILFLLEALLRMVELPSGMRGISYLPLAHIAERMLTHYSAMQKAASIEYIRDPKLLLDTLTTHRPEVVLAVPRVWEKMQAGIQGALAAEDERKRKLVEAAIANGIARVDAQQAGGPIPFGVRAKHALFDRLVFSKLRAKLGVDQVQFALSGAAPISPDLLKFFAALGIEILEVYGMTESTAVITANRPGRVRIGSVGEVVPGTEVRLAEDGEILSRGPHVTPGYLNREDATAETIDADGWLHTGDLGRLEDGYLSIIGRKKELIITAGGKNLSPNNIEETIKQQSPIIATLCAVGDDRPFISALVVLDSDVLPGWCAARGIEYEDVAQAAAHPDVVAEVERAIEAGNAHLARVEQVKRWTLLGSEWTPESEEMTPSMKLKRAIIHTKYQDTIDTMYGG